MSQRSIVLKTAAIGLAAVTGVTTVGALGSSASAADATRCSTGTVPSVVQGDPHVKAGAALGFYIWHGAGGYSLRVTHANNKKVVLSGRLTASAGFSHVDRVRLEKSDSLKVSADHKTLTFRFTNYGKVDGINFSANCSKTLQVQLRIGGSQAPTSRIKLGAHRTSPTSNPFRIERTAPRPAPTATATPTASGTPSTG